MGEHVEEQGEEEEEEEGSESAASWPGTRAAAAAAPLLQNGCGAFYQIRLEGRRGGGVEVQGGGIGVGWW